MQRMPTHPQSGSQTVFVHLAERKNSLIKNDDYLTLGT